MKTIETKKNVFVWVDGCLYLACDNGDTHLNNYNLQGRYTFMSDCTESEAEAIAKEIENNGI